jgi:hypothetical protein
MESKSQIMFDNVIRLISGTTLGTYATILNIKQSSMVEIMNNHLAIANGLIGLVIGTFTLVFLYYQITKIRRDLKNKK